MFKEKFLLMEIYFLINKKNKNFKKELDKDKMSELKKNNRNVSFKKAKCLSKKIYDCLDFCINKNSYQFKFGYFSPIFSL